MVDLGVGFLGIPLYAYYLQTPFKKTENCVAITLVFRASYLPLGSSIITLSAIVLERYIGVLHPFQYNSEVTKKRVLIYVCGNGFVLFSVVAYSFRDPTIMKFYVRMSIAAFFIFTVFACIRIYLVIRKLIRSEKRVFSDDHGSQVNR